MCKDVNIEMKEQGGINLIDKVIVNNNLLRAYKKVKENKGAPGVDGITVTQLKSHMRKILRVTQKKVEDGNYHLNQSKELPYSNQMGPNDT